MKKITLPALALVALIVASCAKEKDGYDKNLTKETWTLSDASIVNETVVENDYTDGTPNTTNTQRNTTTIKGGESVNENYQIMTEVGNPDFFTRDIETSDLTITYKFEQEGTFESNTNSKRKSVSHEETGIPITTVTVTEEGTTSSSTGLWSWQNTGDQKSLLSFDLGELQVDEITKDQMVLKLNKKSTEVSKPSSAETETETQTTTVTITFTR